MIARTFFAALLLAAATALSAEKPVSHFAEVPLSKLQVMQLIDDDALVEGPAGEVALVRTGDLLGREQAKVARVSNGCVLVKLGRATVSLCADAPEAPRS